MEVNSNMSSHAPKYICLPANTSQSKHGQKIYNLAFTSTLDGLNREKFITLQLKLIKMITDKYKGHVFKIKMGPDNDETLDLSQEDEPMFNPPVQEILVKDKKKSFISVHPVTTTMLPHAMKKDKEIVKFLDDNNFGLRRHHWYTNEVDVARPYYILTQDPKFMHQSDVLQQVDIPSGLIEELSALNIKILPAQLQQKKTKKLKKPKSTQAFAIEIASKERDKLFNAVTKHLPPTNNTLLPAKLCYTNTQAWNNAVQFQVDHNDHTKCLTLVNVGVDQADLMQMIAGITGVYSVTRRDPLTMIDQWNIRIQRNNYDVTVGKISEILTEENKKQAPEADLIHFLDISSDEQKERKEAKAFYSTAAETYANIKFDRATNSVNVVPPTPKKTYGSRNNRGSYASIVSPPKINPDKARIQELEEKLKIEEAKVKQLTLQLHSKQPSESSTVTSLSADSFKNEIRDMLFEHTTQIKEWVSSQVKSGLNSEPSVTESKAQHTSLARAVFQPSGKTKPRNKKLDLTILEKLTADKREDKKSTDSVSVFSDKDEEMKDPTSLGKRDHHETYCDDDCGTVYKDSREVLSDELLTQPAANESDVSSNSALVNELTALNEDRSKRVYTGRDPKEDPQTSSRAGGLN